MKPLSQRGIMIQDSKFTGACKAGEGEKQGIRRSIRNVGWTQCVVLRRQELVKGNNYSKQLTRLRDYAS